MYGETLEFQCQHSNGNIKCPIGKSVFAVNLPLKLFRAICVNGLCQTIAQKEPYLVLKLSSQENTQRFPQRTKQVPKMRYRTKQVKIQSHFGSILNLFGSSFLELFISLNMLKKRFFIYSTFKNGWRKLEEQKKALYWIKNGSESYLGNHFWFYICRI